MLRLPCILILALAWAAPAFATLDDLLAHRPGEASTRHPLVPKHLAHDAIEDDPHLATTAWPIGKWGGRCLHPAGEAPWSGGRHDDPDDATFLAWWSGDAPSVPRGMSADRIADLTLALALEEWMGRVRGSSLQEDHFDQAVAYARAPDPVRREALHADAAELVARDPDLWERIVFLTAGGLLGAAAVPGDRPWADRERDAEDAARLLDAILGIRPGSSPALFWRAHLHVWMAWRARGERGVPDLAVDLWDRALRAEPDDGRSAVSLARAYRLAGRDDLAQAFLASWSPRLDDWKKPRRAQALRHLASIGLALGEREDVGWTDTAARRLLERAQDLDNTVTGRISLLARIDAEVDAGADDDAASDAVRHRIRLARTLVELSDDLDAPGPWQEATRDLIRILLVEAMDRLDGIPDEEVRDERIEDLHWAWVEFREGTPPDLGPDRALTERVHALVEDSNQRRWRARRLKTGRYEEALGL